MWISILKTFAIVTSFSGAIFFSLDKKKYPWSFMTGLIVCFVSNVSFILYFGVSNDFWMSILNAFYSGIGVYGIYINARR